MTSMPCLKEAEKRKSECPTPRSTSWRRYWLPAAQADFEGEKAFVDSCGQATATAGSCALLDRPAPAQEDTESPIASAVKGDEEHHRASGRSRCRWGWLAICLVLAAMVGLRGTRPGTPADAPANSKPHIVTKAIEEVQLGQRMLGENPELNVADRGATEPNPATWRKLRLRTQGGRFLGRCGTASAGVVAR